MELNLPFPRRTSAHRASARTHNLDWLQSHGMLTGDEAIELYSHWDIPDLAARSFPDLDADELGLATDLFSFYFLFDDQFDSELGLRPADVVKACAPLVDIVHGDHKNGPESPITSSFADLWRRSSEGMSSRWRARAASNWEWYFSAHPSEAMGRLRAAEDAMHVPDRSSYLMLRRGADGTETVLDMIERFAAEVPPAAFHSPQLRLMRQLAADAPAFSNDVYSYDKEAPRGDVYNLVVILQHQRQCGRAEASAAVLAEAQWMIDQYLQLAVEIPELCDRLELSRHERQAVERYADGLAAWMGGYFDWEARTARYQPQGSPPVDQPGHLEPLLTARETRSPNSSK
ncbi:terpene cyclase [Streptacidiphilus sp. PB12-B1b]|uniref:terpene synthase family protein n=1 Tax=Streptacidiphilus sp. PB12-B1b TaxID=2705012 RepID=UPI0015F95266|nr:terpene cyclase [Streptacidiphilus sp. PB12-B1b]QMU74888.1 terpene cyclase [Streptacidiphilus sp. PB12-B1b]